MASKRTPKGKFSAHSGVSSLRRAFIGNIGDTRSDWYRRRRDLVRLHVNDLGGPEMLSVAQISLVQRASSIEVACELMEGRMSRGEEVDIDIYTRTASHLRRFFETIGIERVQKDVTRTIREYFAHGNGALEIKDRPIKAIADEIAARLP